MCCCAAAKPLRPEELIEERVIGSERPLKDEVKAIREHERAKEEETLELERLEDAYKGI